MDKSTASKDDATDDVSTVHSPELLESLQRRADSLLTEFRSYQTYLKSKNLSKDVETRIFRRGVEAEHKNLGAFTPADNVREPDFTDEFQTKGSESKRLQALRSSNLPFYEAVWASAKRCRGVRALGRRLYWDNFPTDADINHLSNQGGSPKPMRKKQRSALVDIVADDGAEWIKVSIVTAKRLIFEMAKEGWEGYGGDSDVESTENEDDRSERTPLSGKAKLELVKLAEDLRDASRSVRIKYRHPQVKLILPRIQEGVDELVDAVIVDLRATGATVVCGDTPAQKLGCIANHDHASRPTFDIMLPSPCRPLPTPTLNIDCTILLALISDISHVARADLPPSPTNASGTYHNAILKQVESEESAPLLPSELYPAMEGKQLVCTALAAKRMREIVETMGTKSELERAELLLGEGRYAGQSPKDLREAWQGLSCHQLSANINFPIIVEDFRFDPAASSHGDAECAKHTSANNMAHRLSQAMRLSAINASVFIYGWINDIITVTSNKVVAISIERTLNHLLDEDERSGNTHTADSKDGENSAAGELNFVAPKIYVCETARSLIGKEKVNGLRP